MLLDKVKDADIKKRTIFFVVLYTMGLMLSVTGSDGVLLSFTMGSGFVDMLLLSAVIVKKWLWILSIIGLLSVRMSVKYKMEGFTVGYRVLYVVCFCFSVLGFVVSELV